MRAANYIKKSLDTTNAFLSTDSEAIKVNPKIWDIKLRDYEEKNLVVTPLAQPYDFRSYGRDFTITVDVASSAAAALTETTDVTISAISNRQVTYTPTEYGAAYQVTRKEMVRAFFDVGENMTKKLGYSMAQKKDALGYAILLSGAGNAVLVNSKSVATDLASTDTLDYASITKAIALNETDLYTRNKYLLINYTQKQQLLNLGTINKANEFGTRDAIQNGLVGELFGLLVFATHSVTTTANVAYAVVLAESQTGEAAFGYAIKRDPMIEKEYHALGRYWDIVGHEEYDFKVLHPNAICTIATYA